MQDAQPIRPLPRVAVFPWSFSENERGTSEKGVATTQTVLHKLFEDRAGMVILPEAECRDAWASVTGQPWVVLHEEPASQPPVPSAAQLLKFGQSLKADYVCAGSVAWHVRSVWVGLGPKTKAYANVNVRIVDVKKEELALEAKDFRSDSGKAEKWYETAGALFLTWGITLFSGGPKTPQIERSGAIGVGAATEPFFATIAPGARKITKDGGG